MKAVIHDTFWTGATGRQLAGKPDAQRLALYLLSGPSATAIGLYRLTLEIAARDVGLTEAAARKAMQVLIDIGFCRFDEQQGVVWVIEMAKWQLGGTLSASDKRVKGIQAQVDLASGKPFTEDFVRRYGSAYHLRQIAPPPPPPAPKPAAKPEPEPQPEAEPPLTDKKKTAKQLQRDIDIRSVISHYQTFHPLRARGLTREKPEWRHINARLDDGYTPAELKTAITAMCNDSWYTEKNLDQLEMAVRSGKKVDEFLARAANPRDSKPVLSEKTQRSATASQRLLDQMYGSEDDLPDVEEVIDVE